MEQIRIVKEMRERDERNGRSGIDIRPRYMVWENVPGAFNSNKGEDFRIVLEEIAKVADKDAIIPMPDNGKWTTCGCIVGDGWSVAWRVLDAQFWGVPQRRRRIALVADFGGESAPEILLIRKSLSGDIEPSKPKRKATSSDASRGFGADDRLGADQYNAVILGDTVSTLGVNCGMSHGRQCVHEPQGVITFEPGIASREGGHIYEGVGGTLRANARDNQMATAYGISSYNSNAMMSSNPHSGIYEADTSRTLDLNGGNPSCNQGGIVIVEPVAYTLQDREGKAGGGKGALIAKELSATLRAHDAQRPDKELCKTLNCMDDPMKICIVGTRYIVRRLTPLECERLQGYPDGWTDIGEWVDSNGKKRQTSDAARYKALGNSIALPPWKWVLKRICACYERDATLGSLFDGIGGFGLLWEQLNGKGSCLWASEVEDFCIAVTERRINNA
jgi:DNA (cytosine-5)-methyltransferase 1